MGGKSSKPSAAKAENQSSPVPSPTPSKSPAPMQSPVSAPSPSPSPSSAPVQSPSPVQSHPPSKSAVPVQLLTPVQPPQPQDIGDAENLILMNTRMDEVTLRLDELANNLNVARVRRSLYEKKIFGAVLTKVPENYYAQTLKERADILKASSTSQLCKTIVLENTAKGSPDSKPFDLSDLTDPKYVAVIVQYEAKIDTDILANKIHSLRPPEQQIARKKFKFQLAPESVSDELTGFIHNAVTPFGMTAQIPVLICQRCLDCTPSFLFLGGGAVDVKLGMSISDLTRGSGAVSLGYISQPRSPADLGDE